MLQKNVCVLVIEEYEYNIHRDEKAKGRQGEGKLGGNLLELP